MQSKQARGREGIKEGGRDRDKDRERDIEIEIEIVS